MGACTTTKDIIIRKGLMASIHQSISASTDMCSGGLRRRHFGGRDDLTHVLWVTCQVDRTGIDTTLMLFAAEK